MEQFLKIEHQDGLIYFDKFRIAEVLIYPSNNGHLVLNIDIRTLDGPYIESEINQLEDHLNETINSDFDYVWIGMTDYILPGRNFVDLQNQTIELQGENYNLKDHLSQKAHIYLGWTVELRENRIELKTIGDQTYLSWSAKSADVNYYDRAIDCSFQLETAVEIKEFQDEKDFQKYQKQKDLESDRYFSILRILEGQAITGKDDFDISFIEPTDSNLRNSELAWENRNKIKPSHNNGYKQAGQSAKSNKSTFNRICSWLTGT